MCVCCLSEGGREGGGEARIPLKTKPKDLGDLWIKTSPTQCSSKLRALQEMEKSGTAGPRPFNIMQREQTNSNLIGRAKRWHFFLVDGDRWGRPQKGSFLEAASALMPTATSRYDTGGLNFPFSSSNVVLVNSLHSVQFPLLSRGRRLLTTVIRSDRSEFCLDRDVRHTDQSQSWVFLGQLGHASHLIGPNPTVAIIIIIIIILNSHFA